MGLCSHVDELVLGRIDERWGGGGGGPVIHLHFLDLNLRLDKELDLVAVAHAIIWHEPRLLNIIWNKPSFLLFRIFVELLNNLKHLFPHAFSAALHENAPEI